MAEAEAAAYYSRSFSRKVSPPVCIYRCGARRIPDPPAWLAAVDQATPGDAAARGARPG